MGLRPHDFETGSSRRVTLQPYVSRRRRLPLLPRERFSPWAESGHWVSRLTLRRIVAKRLTSPMRSAILDHLKAEREASRQTTPVSENKKAIYAQIS